MTRVLIVAPYFAPDLAADAPLYDMLAQQLARSDFDVSVVCAVPHYPSGRVAAGFRGKLFQTEGRNGVRVTRVWVPSIDRSRLSLRLLTFCVYQLLATLAAMFRRFDVLIISSPAFVDALPFFLLRVLRRKPAIYAVHEVYPDIGVKLGIFRHRAVIALLDRMERFVCAQSNLVRVISNVYKRQLLAKGVADAKIVEVHDWVDTDLVTPQPRRNALSAEWKLDAAFVVQYAGTLGPTQGLETVLAAAHALRAATDVRFLLVGEGSEKPALEAAANKLELNNVAFYPFQSRERLPLVLATADVALLTLKRGFATDSVPSKLYSIMASGRPVICCVDKGSDTWNMVLQAQCGLCVEPEDPPALVAAISQLRSDAGLRQRMGANGRAYVVQNHSQYMAGEAFTALIGRVLGRTQEGRDAEVSASKSADRAAAAAQGSGQR